VKVEVKTGDGLQRQIFVEIPAESVNAELDTQYREKRKSVTLKGFRKGKAPLDMIKSLFKDEVTINVADNLIKVTYPEAIREAKLKVATAPSVSALDFTDEGGLTYTAEVEVFPELGTVKYDGLKVTPESVEVADSDIDEIVEMYRTQYSELRVVERPAGEKDVVVADLHKLEDPKEVMKEDIFEGVEVDLSKGQTVKEFKQALTGAKVGDEPEVEVTYGYDYADPRFAGARIKYRCKVTAVKERILPEFNDALAKQTKMAETVLEFRLKVREQLEKEKKDIEKNRMRQETITQMVEKNRFDIPEAMLKEYLDAAVQDVKKQYPDASEEEIRQSYTEPGRNQMRWNFLYHELAEQEKIEVLPSDTEKWINGFAETNNVTAEQAKQLLARDNRAKNLLESLLEEKVLDFLLEKASQKAG
jgi:trigger factor